MKADDQLSLVFAALADPTRRAILARLADGDATVTELAEPFSISLPAISRHLKVLEHAGLISRSRSGQWRSSSLEATALKEATDWMERYRIFWDSSFDRLDAHLRRVQRDASQSSVTEKKGRAARKAPSERKTSNGTDDNA
jgi:DNA-binding transcriptional ArsR family regulator